MKDNVKVSVIIPVYNAEKYLRECLDSVVGQSLKDIEIICVDDGSTDGSVEILKEYSSYDSRVRVLKQKNQGAGPARNLAIESAVGQFIAFMDSDDYYAQTNALEKLYYAAIDNGALVSGGSMLFLKEDNIIPACSEDENYFFDKSGWIDYRNLQQDYFYQRFLFNREFLTENSITFPNYRRYQDPPFFVRAMILAGKFYSTQDDVYVYRLGSIKNWTAEKICDMIKGVVDVLELTAKEKLGHLHYVTASRILNINYMHNIIRNAVQGHKVNLSSVFSRFHHALDYGLLSKEGKELNIKYLVSMESGMYDDCLDISKKEALKFSLVVPVYNVEPYLSKCLDSLVKQTYQYIEIICVDDGSSDNSLSILQSYAALDQRIKIVAKDKNEGLLAARKSGVLLATGEYIVFVDSDDYLELDACEELNNILQEYQADIVQFTAGVKDYSSDKSTKDWLEKYLIPNSACLSGEELLDSFYTKRNNVTVLWGKAYTAELCKAVYNNIPDFHCYVGEDQYQQFYFAFFADSYIGIKTKPLYWYQYGLGVSNSNLMKLEKFELYCKMADLAVKVREFLRSKGCESQYYKYYESVSSRMLEDCCRVYKNSLADLDTRQGGKLLLKYWHSNPVTDAVLHRCIGMSLKEFASKYIDIPVYTKLNRTFSESSVKPKVSVIIPVYNVELYLRDCLDSIVNQTFSYIEIICVNDGSTDGSLAILEEYYAQDDRVSIISRENAGSSVARNVGMQQASGEYILFVDSDDMLKANAIENLLKYSEENKLDVLYYEAETIFQSDDIRQKFWKYNTYYRREKVIPEVLTGEELFSKLIANKEYRVQPCLQFTIREHIQENQIAFTEGIIHEDNLFTFKNLLLANRTSVINEAYYIRRVREGSIMTHPQGYINLYGYLTCFAGMLSFVGEKCFDKHVLEAFETVVGSMRNLACSIYNKLDESERLRLNELNPIERMWLQMAISSTEIPRLTTAIKEKDTKLAELTKNVKEKDSKLAELTKNVKEKDSKLAELTKSVKEKDKKIRVLSKANNALKNSLSFKIGRAITFVPRKIRGGIKCFKEHGLCYTFKRLLWHLGIKR